MKSRLNPLSWLCLLVVLVGLFWLLFVWKPSSASMARPTPPDPDPLITYTFMPEVYR